MLTVKKLDFSYDGGKKVLNDIHMQFLPGKVYGIFGKSGAGKSTLLSLLAGLEKVKSGEITFDGCNINQMNCDRYRSNQIGVVFQAYNLLPHLTALENVILSMDISIKKIENKKEKALTLLEKVGINKEEANRKALELSGGQQQRVAIARALSYDSQIILADEPTGNLDHETESDIISLLQTLAHHDGKCIIIISHSPSVQAAVDEHYYLKNGKIDIKN